MALLRWTVLRSSAECIELGEMTGIRTFVVPEIRYKVQFSDKKKPFGRELGPFWRLSFLLGV